jgi:hypothetical protein
VPGSFPISEIILDSELIFPYICPYPDPSFEGRLPEAFCRRGTGAAPASEGLTQPSSPGRTRAASSGTSDPARSDHGQRHKGQDAALARRKARGVTLHAQTIPAWSNPGSALSARHPPRSRGRRKREMRATPWPRAANRGRFSFDSTKVYPAQWLVGWAKALARCLLKAWALVRRARRRLRLWRACTLARRSVSAGGCPPAASMGAATSMVGTAHARLSLAEKRLPVRLCPPYKSGSPLARQR